MLTRWEGPSSRLHPVAGQGKKITFLMVLFVTGILQNTLGEYNTSPWSQLGLDNLTTFIQYYTVIFQSNLTTSMYSIRYDYEAIQISAICEHGE